MNYSYQEPRNIEAYEESLGIQEPFGEKDMRCFQIHFFVISKRSKNMKKKLNSTIITNEFGLVFQTEKKSKLNKIKGALF